MAHWERICLPVKEIRVHWLRSLDRKCPLEEETVTHPVSHTSGSAAALLSGLRTLPTVTLSLPTCKMRIDYLPRVGGLTCQ